jgi:Zn-dependent M28 family amino/carboxypeptidase
LKANVVSVTEHVESPNIVGKLEGSDPKLKNEYVVLTAHLDHLGVGEPINGDRIYNGAMDDGSGVATLLEVANELTAAKTRLKRSVLFVVVCGEEKGLLGSRYFAGHPTVPKQALAADLNVDMFLPLFPLQKLIVMGQNESTLGDDARAVGSPMGVEVIQDPQPDRNAFIRSDQYSFIRQGVPSVAFHFGASTPEEERTAKTWLTERYHAPGDDLNQPVDLAAAAKFNAYYRSMTERVANEETRPQWKQKSFFRRFAQ